MARHRVGARGQWKRPFEFPILPIVAFDQFYSFDRQTLLNGIPRPEPAQGSQKEGQDKDGQDQEQQFQASAEELFDRIMQLADNAGATDEHRAVNYLAVRYDRIYVHTAEMYNRNFSLMAVDVRTVVFSYTNRATDITDKYFVRVDVTEEFPFLVTKLSPYYDR